VLGVLRDTKKIGLPVWSKISNALKRLGFRYSNFLAQLLSENLKSMYHPGSTIKFREALE
jgi:hypothetical protein